VTSAERGGGDIFPPMRCRRPLEFGSRSPSCAPAVVRATHVAAFSIHVLLRDRRGSALFRRVAHDRLLSDPP
jgi:hypothetical protein